MWLGRVTREGKGMEFLVALAAMRIGVKIVDFARNELKLPQRRERSTSQLVIAVEQLVEVVVNVVVPIAITLNLLTETEKRSMVSAFKRSMVSTFKRLSPLLAKAGVGIGVIISFPILRKRYSAATAFQKKKRVRDFEYFIEGPDENYISRLPDDILCHIISYLDKKDEAQTFVLSRRWRRIYYSLLPNPKFVCHKMIEFASLTEHNNCRHRNYKQRFVTGVHEMFELVSLMMHGNCHCNDKQTFVTAFDTFLLLRTDLPMESFTLRFGLRRGFSGHLRRWLDCIVRSSVRKLNINFCCEYELCRIPFSQLIVFPFMVLSSASTLEYVQLSSCILELNFEGPFNSLKELKLSRVPLVNLEVEIILSCCPQLKSLKLFSCKLPSKLLVIALELRTLDLEYCELNQIGFYTPNLDYFSYRNNCGLSFLPSHVPNLRSLYLNMSCHKRPPQGVGGFVSFAPCLCKLWIQATPRQVQDIQKEMPKLSNLEELSLNVIRGSLDLRDIVSLIAVCPNISSFEFSSPHCSLSYTERDAEVPLTFVNLKDVWLDGFKSDAAHMKFASQLLRCAPTLRNMWIYTAYCFFREGKNVEKTLPSERRYFPYELISGTKQQLQGEASSPTAVVSISESYVIWMGPYPINFYLTY